MAMPKSIIGKIFGIIRPSLVPLLDSLFDRTCLNSRLMRFACVGPSLVCVTV